MRVPLSWLREYAPISASAHEVAERLTLAGIEVEEVVGVGAFSPLVVIGRILENRPAGNDRSVAGSRSRPGTRPRSR